MEEFHTREILDYEKSCRPVLSDALTDPDSLSIGDHIHWSLLGQWLDGIVIDKIRKLRRMEIRVIRYCDESSIFQSSSIEICEENWHINFDKQQVHVYDYDDHCHPPSLVIFRAMACVGQTGYNALRNDNVDFCRWCKCGKHTYVCINEVFLCSETHEMSEIEEGVYLVDVGSLDDMNQGDHVRWLKRYQRTEEKNAEWNNGIVLDVDQKHGEIISFVDKSHSAVVMKFTCLDFADHLVQQYVYKQCHMPDDVLERAKSCIGTMLFPEKSRLIARWCKLGIPCDSDSIDKKVLSPKPINTNQEREAGITEEVGSYRVGANSAIGARVAMETTAKHASKNLGAHSAIGARVAMETTAKHATKHLGAHSAIGARVAMETTARHAPKHLAKRAAHGVARGGASVAAVGVEALLLSVDMHLTYKSFSRKEITKDEVHRQNIQNSIRSATAATGSLGGGAAGAAIGSLIFPGVGTITGGIIGSIFGGLSGHIGGHVAGKNIAEVARRPYENLFVEDDIEIVEENQTESNE